MTAKIGILHEVELEPADDNHLCFQWCEYCYDDGSSEHGYRFMWRKPNGKLASHRGQARIPSAHEMFELICKAAEAGWLGKCERE